MTRNNRILFEGTAEQIENTQNKVSEISDPNSTKQYPSVKAMVDYVENKVEAWLPNVSPNGDLSWSKSATDSPPKTINIKGPQGIQGEQGPQGEAGADYIITAVDKAEIADMAKPEIDQTYDPASENPQSGMAVAEAFERQGLKLLKNITLEEAVKSIDFTFDKPVKEFLILISGTMDSGTDATIACRTDGGSNYFGWYAGTKMNATNNKTFFFHAKEVAKGHWETIAPLTALDTLQGIDASGRNAKIIYTYRGTLIANGRPRYINNLNIFTTNTTVNFATGLNIRIWGVEAE